MTETEADTRANRIDPVLREAGWGVVSGSHIARELTISPGRILGGGQRMAALSADYVLSYRGRQLAVLEAKRAGLGHTAGVGQAKQYASLLKARFGYSSNGIGWYGIDMQTGAEADIALPFPSPDELWQRCFPEGNDWRERFGTVPFETGGGKWQPRYYQHNAINAVLEAIAQDRTRILLTLATGTGKTSIAFQIAWKLFESRWNLSRDPVRRPRILFLADRNILADQAYNAFSAFAPDALCRISPGEIRKQGKLPRNASVFFTIFQTFMTDGNETTEPKFTFEGYAPDFFDFIIIDECHRGGAKDESAWRGILEYFKPAVQLGLTATPKRDANADTYAYFGEPVYTYALKEGIGDGFLTPFKVRQMASTLDTYRFTLGDTVVSGEIDPDKEYSEADLNTRLRIDSRELSRVQEFMDQIDQRQKTLVFCATQDHAARVRNFINQVKDNPDPHYCERVTADDGELGERHLREFQDNEKTLPTILTTSQKLSTGVDARNVRNIALLRPIKSMVEFKQIIGRGTRTFDGKDFFTIYDFVKAYEHFNDPEWDGEPLPPEPVDKPKPRPRPGDEGEPPTGGPDKPPGGTGEAPAMIVVELGDGRERNIRYLAATTYWSNDGRLITAQEFMQQLFGDLNTLVADEDQLRAVWSDPDRRQGFLQRLTDMGYGRERLDDMRRLIDAPNSDIFDVLAYVRFTLAPLARTDRAEAARASGLQGHEQQMREFLDYVLRAYEMHGVDELAPNKLGDLLRVRYGGANDAKRVLGSVADIRNAFIAIQGHLYR